MTEKTYTGGCLCGAVRYEVEGPLHPVHACHCRQCRRQSGHFFAATGAPKEALTVVSGTAELRWYRASAHAARGFCSVCGSALFWQADEGGSVEILAGSMDEPNDLRLAAHYYVADKGGYYEIADGLPQSQAEEAAESTSGKGGEA